jgi:hypothetical protein
LNNRDFLLWRLSFDGSACLALWCAFSEIITDLANGLLSNPDWTPSDFKTTDNLPDLEPSRLPVDITLAQTLPCLLLPPTRPSGSVDVFIDDTGTLFIDTPSNTARAPKAVLIATATLARPVSPDEPLPRETLLSLDKYMAEGHPDEIKSMLGWILDFRPLTIPLPPGKHATWTTNINILVKDKRVKRKALEQLIGKLNHTCQVLPMARYFLGPLRHLMSHAKSDFSTLKINRHTESILKHWKYILDNAKRGVSFNSIVVQKPTNIIIMDAWPGELGDSRYLQGGPGVSDSTSQHFRIIASNSSQQ